jgi:hypothetical protein
METDLYVFASEADQSLVGEKRSLGSDQGLRFVAATTGRFQAFAVVEVDDLGSVPGFLYETFGNPGATGLQTAFPLRKGPMQIRWTKQYEYIAFSRIRAKPGRALDVLASTAIVPGYNGSAVVAGGFDLLVEYGADDFEELKDILLYGLHDVSGVAWSETALVTEYFYRGERGQGAAS